MISNVESQPLDTPSTELKPCADDQIHDDHVWVASKHFHCLGRTTTKEHDLAMARVDILVSCMFTGGFQMGYALNDVTGHIANGRITMDEVLEKVRKGFEERVAETVRRYQFPEDD